MSLFGDVTFVHFSASTAENYCHRIIRGSDDAWCWQCVNIDADDFRKYTGKERQCADCWVIFDATHRVKPRAGPIDIGGNFVRIIRQALHVDWSTAMVRTSVGTVVLSGRHARLVSPARVDLALSVRRVFVRGRSAPDKERRHTQRPRRARNWAPFRRTVVVLCCVAADEMVIFGTGSGKLSAGTARSAFVGNVLLTNENGTVR